MCGFGVVRRVNYLGGEAIREMKTEVRVWKFKSAKAAGKDEVTGEMIKG